MPDTIENLRKRLIFRSDHRGTKEMDLLMGSFARKFVPNFSEQQLKSYEMLLENNDPDLYNWITGQETAPANTLGYEILDKVIQHKFV